MGIVDIDVSSLFICNPFKPARYIVKCINSVFHFICGNTHACGNACGQQNIFKIVGTGQGRDKLKPAARHGNCTADTVSVQYTVVRLYKIYRIMAHRKLFGFQFPE